MTRFREWLQGLWSRWTRQSSTVADTVGIRSNIRVAVYDTRELKRVSDWDALTDEAKLGVMDDQAPLREHHHHNTTTVDLFEYLVDDLDQNQSVDVDVTHLAFGDDGTHPSSGNRSLNNEVYRTTIASSTDAGDTLETRTLLDTSEANGYTLREIGLVTASSGGLLLNHSLINDEAKNDQKAFSIDVSLSAGPA